jgi:hypothetical protein
MMGVFIPPKSLDLTFMLPILRFGEEDMSSKRINSMLLAASDLAIEPTTPSYTILLTPNSLIDRSLICFSCSVTLDLTGCLKMKQLGHGTLLRLSTSSLALASASDTFSSQGQHLHRVLAIPVSSQVPVNRQLHKLAKEVAGA